MTNNTLLYLEAAKILTYTALSFFIAMWWAPYLIRFLNWLKFWKKKPRSISTTGEELVVTKQFYIENEKKKLIPRGGGLLIWITALGFALFFWVFLKIEPENKLFQFLNFISRSETFIPLGTLFFGSIIGLIDDSLATMEAGGNYEGGGLKLSQRVISITLFSLLISFWFFFKINLDNLSFFGINFNFGTWFEFEIFNGGFDFFGLEIQALTLNGGILIIPITVIILLASWGTRIIDGFDGLAAGILIPIYLCFGGLAFARGYYDITTLMLVIVGATTAYLWFNIPPARFYMGDTGTDGLLLMLGVVAILTDYVYILPIAGIMLFLTELSAVIQIFSKKVFKKKVFLAAPLHHHFEALGLERNQITMRYWLVSIMTSALGLAIGLIFS